ncbi:MAG: hydrogenase expression/formation protein HypE [endosymbiont of Galathealinum brachiosum]|uniref:Hydrogenase expression/formation protein HypE n=1 Tax=endosymbiont of Galathealinum brachiosum TaxID=2200906 RepID=A0A370DG80_9GAMM|nr:MAG: hydrogenase expression/formation protein HypE [endosymbiont of Galathealinum brachiosum]
MNNDVKLDTHISLAHGNGGRFMRELIDEIFSKYLSNDDLDVQADAASLKIEKTDIMFTTDGFTVQPLEFPGGNIGSLAVHGTTNDLAVSGAIPKYLSLNAFIEEGMEVKQLERIVKSLARSANEVGVKIVAGDTKVLPRGQGGGLYLATTGIGIRDNDLNLSLANIKNKDVMLLSGSVGDHGISVMLAREQFGLSGKVVSDSASVLAYTQALSGLEGVHFMRDPTRGGLATVCHEISRFTKMGIRLQQDKIPVKDPVQSVCEMLGYDPLFLACEGRVVAVVNEVCAEEALSRWKALPDGQDAIIFGELDENITRVVLMTEFGGERILEELEDDPLPRIC